jgi:hypothetical protein
MKKEKNNYSAQLLLGFSLINIMDLKNRVEGKRDNLILEIMIYFKKISASLINDIEQSEATNIMINNGVLLNSLKNPFIDFIAGSVIISNTIIENTELIDDDIENFLYITSLYYDLYADIIKDIKDESIKELYKNSFDISKILIEKIKRN